ncbi:MAG: quinone oxidoreductase [Kineosporiaceae bacterium]
MRFVRYPVHGGPEVLELATEPEAEPGPGDLLVEVAAAGVNFVDTYRRSGLYPGPLPGRCGSEGAGRVIAVGAPSAAGDPDPSFRVGDVVAWTDVSGSYADRLLVPAASAVAVPDAVGPATAAAVLLQGLTARLLVREAVHLSPGDAVLVHAGAGGVGLLVVQLAAAAGVTVVATVSDPAKAEVVREAGAAHVIGYDGPDGDFATQVEALLGPRPLAAVLDGVGRATFDRGLGLLRPRGVFVSYGNASGPVDPVAPLRLAEAGSVYLTRPRLWDYLDSPAVLRERAAALFDEVASGRLRVRVGAQLPLADAAAAHRLLESRASTGKVLLVP